MFLRSVLPLSAVLLATLTALLFIVATPLADKPSAAFAHGVLSDYERIVAAFVAMGKQRRLVPNILAPRACHPAFHGTL